MRTVPLRESAVRSDDQRLDYMPGRCFVGIANDHDVAIAITGLDILLEIAPDNNPELVFQLIPFMDILAVRVLNVGWGQFEGGTLSLASDVYAHASPWDGKGNFVAPSSNAESPDLRRLFDLQSLTIDLPRIDESTVAVLRVGPNRVPFIFTPGGRVDTSRFKKPARLHPPLHRYTTTPAKGPHTVDEYRTIEGAPEWPFSGSLSFRGSLLDKSGKKESVTYLTRVLSRCPGENIGALCDSNWRFSFGNTVSKHVYETLTAEHYAVTVDLGDLKRRRFHYDVNLTVPARKSVDFEFEFIADRSCHYQGHAECAFRVGGARHAVAEPVEGTLEGYVHAPRGLSVDTTFAGTTKIVGELMSLDMDLENRATQQLTRLLGEPAIEIKPWESGCHDNLLSNAISVCFCGSPDSRLLINRLLSRFGGDVRPERTLLIGNETKSVLCSYDPRYAIGMDLNEWLMWSKRDASVPLFGTRAPDLRGPWAPEAPEPWAWERGSYSFPVPQWERVNRLEKEEFLKQFVPKVQQYLANVPRPWPEEAVRLCVFLHLPEATAILKEELSNDDAFCVSPLSCAQLAWAVGELRNPEVDAAVARRIEVSKSALRDEFIQSLGSYRNGCAGMAVVNVLENAGMSAAVADTLAVCLGYIVDCRIAMSSRLQAALRRLRLYPFRADVRETARELLGEAPRRSRWPTSAIN